jgi:replication factor C subunit 2/4
MSKYKNLPWVEKYRPQTVSDITADDNIISVLHSCVKEDDMPHLLFHGPPGTGKTSSIHAIAHELFGDDYKKRIYELNASDDRGIQAVREIIKSYAKLSVNQAATNNGRIVPPYKIIILDEADAMTRDAQDALRVIIEENCAVTRFCFICNYTKQIINPIKSRCAMFEFHPIPSDKIIERLKRIAQSEGLVCEENVYQLIAKIVNGDLRKAIMMLQNIKYIYDYRNLFLSKDPVEDSKLDVVLSVEVINKITSPNITTDDILKISGYLHQSKCEKIIKKCVNANSIKEIKKISHEVIAGGYPIDTVLQQLCDTVLLDAGILKIDIERKMKIIEESSEIHRRIKECGHQYLQILEFLSIIYKYTHLDKFVEK